MDLYTRVLETPERVLCHDEKISPQPRPRSEVALHAGRASRFAHGHPPTHQPTKERSTIHPHEERPPTNAHPHAHAPEEPEGHLLAPFPHEKLDAYGVALEMAALSKKIAENAETRGECAGVAAADLVLLLVLEIASGPDPLELKNLAGRVSAMLTRLIARLQ